MLKPASIGDTLSTQYFDVIVNGVRIRSLVGGSFNPQRADKGNVFMVLNVTFKNTDSESRMIEEGVVYLVINGKQYMFDKTELVMFDGYGTYFDQINPLTSKTTKLVYQIPANVVAKGFYHPGRAEYDQLIYLGDIIGKVEK